ncbi:pentatricopeptide repeat-containing protein At1g02060, chloroplastic-like [Cornus florida]|uniref:pentatricopeptide repeat-containing protein At1g02060, chloroplastic-like n=1 Tax=Cornus florida TaxID=4283 RepID=UPI002897DE1F|nr:pentatricopeptide repeat-containing protein At1g02060, chloroplastic-like [Cornus florida]XP_059627840.1 pentatricopeptide repeat-containing protein At1g02060, chloroplastic-like [Cornus florida]XP_059627841.1 pentatricopeptide repeat-containing protein At1g02060, chloroplastic-like [Cornus florida]
MASFAKPHQSYRFTVFGTRFSQPISCCTSRDPSQLPSSSRHFSSEQTNDGDTHDDNGGKDKDPNIKPRSSTKTKRARKMARLINDNPWSADLESSLSSLSPSLSKTTVLQTLQLIRTPSKALYFFNWIHQKGFSHNDQSYFMMIEILGRNRNLNAARNFLFSIEKNSGGTVKLEDKYFNSLIRSYGRAGLFQESIKVFTKMKSIGISPSVVTFNSLLSILLRRGRTTMALKVYDEMLVTYGVTPDTYTFNILIRGFCMNSMVDEGFRFFKEMSNYKCEPDVITYNTLVDGLCRSGKVKIAQNVVRGMLKKSSNLNPNVVTYTTLIRGYCAKQGITEALDVFKEMVDRGLKPNRITYNTLIQGLCEAQELDKIKEIFEGTVGGGEFAPDTCTFNTLMNAHCRAGNLDEALKVFEKMAELRVQLDSATYSVLIRSLCQRGDFVRAEELFNKLAEKEILLHAVGCTPLVAAYNPMFEYLCKNGKTKNAEVVFRQLMKRGIQDPPSYKTLIMGHCREGTFQAGYDLLVLMLRRDFVPDVQTYESLIDGLLQKGDPTLAHQTTEKMLKSSHLPKTSTFHSVLTELVKKGCAHVAASFVMLMLERKIRQNIELSTDTVRLLFKSGSWDKGFEIVGSLYENGYMVKIEELIVFLCKGKKLLEARQMLLFSLEKDQKVDIDICSTVVTDLCKGSRIKEAFSLYYELLEKGIQPPLSCLEDLRHTLEVKGRTKEAEFVAKRMGNSCS